MDNGLRSPVIRVVYSSYFGWSVHEFRVFLLQLQNIQELALVINKFNLSHATFDLSPIRFPRLEHFDVSVTCSSVFSWLEIPLLSELSLYCALGFHDNISTEEISSLIDRSIVVSHLLLDTLMLL